jgi:dTDP-4-amino-4,6-dideoxygalactose transaminase
LKNFSVDKVRKIGCFIVKKGAEVRPGFWPLINTPLVKKFFVRNKYLKISDEIYKKSLVLPSNINLNVNDINNIKNIVKTAIKKFSK